MIEPRVFVGTVFTAGAAVSTWVEQANEWGQFGLTVLGIFVGIATLWYTIERARKLRKERKK